MDNFSFHSGDYQPDNRAFLYGDLVKVSFFVRHSQLIMAEECYFFLMASMRKMRMNIPLSYTLEFFEQLFSLNVISKGISDAIITLNVYRESGNPSLEKAAISFYAEVKTSSDILALREAIEMDMIKEINVNTNLLSNIRVHTPENIYAEIYARENDLDDLILLNPHKRIARSIYGNLLFLKENVIKIPKQTEGAYISPLMENFVTFLHKKQLAEIVEAEMIAFESQQSVEIMMFSDEKGIFPVKKIRNKTFGFDRFTDLVAQWNASFEAITNPINKL